MEPIGALEVSEVRFDETVDVVVVGQGAVGAAAVIAARQNEADVLGLERGAAPGGTSALSGGLLDLGGGTALQTACGFDDSPENMAPSPELRSVQGIEDDRVDAYCSGSPEHFEWLSGLGVPFRAAFCDEPNRESADDAGLLFSGGEDSYPFDEIATPGAVWTQTVLRRLCRWIPHGMSRWSRGEQWSQRGGRRPCGGADCGCRDGCRGARTPADDSSRAVRARGGVILATGGFIHNEAMVAEYCPTAHDPDSAWRIGTPNDDGSGIRMGVAVGAAVARLTHSSVRSRSVRPTVSPAGYS